MTSRIFVIAEILLFRTWIKIRIENLLNEKKFVLYAEKLEIRSPCMFVKYEYNQETEFETISLKKVQIKKAREKQTTLATADYDPHSA